MNKQLEDRLFREDDIFGYLDLLKEFKNDYLIIMAVKDTAGKNMPEGVKERIKDLGFRNFTNDLWVTYIGVIENGRIISDQRGIKAENPTHFETVLENGMTVNIYSESFRKGNRCVIKVNGKEYAKQVRGINIVVYNIKSQNVVDSVAYDSHDELIRFYRSYMKVRGNLYKDKCKLTSILPSIKTIRILHWGASYFWNVFDSLVEELKKESNIDLLVIIFSKKDTDVASLMEDKGLSYCYFEDYLVEQDRPDIMLFSTLNDMLYYKDSDLKKIRDYSKLLIALPVSLILNAYDTMHKYDIKLLKRVELLGVDYVILDKLMYSICEGNNKIRNFIIEMGNPKFDSIYKKIIKEIDLPLKWKKISNKYIFLWLVDHDWETGTNVSFDIYARVMFKYFSENEETALIFRPHPHFVRDMIRLKFWTQGDVDHLKAYVEETDNIIWDEFSDYSLSYQMADAIMSEVESGTIISALATKKPICILYRNDCKIYNNHPQVTENYYSCYSEAELIEFLDNMRTGNDPMYDRRCEAFHKYISHFDGLNGKRLKDFILEKYDEKCRESAEEGNLT